MSQPIEQHVPSPEFVSALEGEVVAAFRRQSTYNLPPSVRRRRGVRTALTLALGLVVGAGTAVASAQVQGARVRDSLSASSEMERSLAMMRLEIAEANYQNVKISVEAGARSRDDLIAAELQLRSAQMFVRRIDSQLAEIKLTGAAPRHELWSPADGGRDFVAERLKIDAAWMNDKVAAYERALAEARQKVLVGAIAPNDTLNARWELSNAARDLEFVARQLAWRQSFLENKITKEEIARQVQLHSAMNQLRAVVERLTQAKAREKRAKDREIVGAGTLLDVKRAELEVLENSVEVENMQKLLKQLQASHTLPKKE